MPFTIPFTPAEITAFKDIALGVSAIATGSAAVATATFAYRGLNKWQAETSFKAKFELAKEVVEITYKISNTIYRLRKTIYTIGGQAGLNIIRKSKLQDLINFHDHLQTLSVQIKALFDDEKHEYSNNIVMTSGLIIAEVEQILLYLEEMYNYKAELSAREEDIANGHEVSKMLLDRLKADYEECNKGYKDIFENIKITMSEDKSRQEEKITNLVESSVKNMVDSMDIYLKAK